MVRFKHASAASKQHLEIGCGPGGFTKSHVLPHCSPCSRLVATDKAPDMIEAALKTSSHPSIHYDVLDVEAGDVREFVNKYGKFDRVYSLLTWHFLKDQLTGYRNDPREIFSDMHYFNCEKSVGVLESEVRKLVTDVGLHCNDCQIYESDWQFADIEEALAIALIPAALDLLSIIIRYSLTMKVQMISQDVGEMQEASSNQRPAVCFSLDCVSYSKIEAYPTRESIQALGKITFLEPALEQDQCLDVGCGPGGFTRNYLLDYCRPCRKIVAVDKDVSMIERAREVSAHPNITYDILDIESPDITAFRDKHGKFRRVLSFFCFHIVKDNLAAYRNVAQLLEPGGDSQDVGEMQEASSNQRPAVCFSLDCVSYSKIEAYPTRESIQALGKITFLEPALEQDQCLDVGCGPGGFTRNYLLDYCRPCRKIVAVDKDVSMIERAREVSAHPNITYDILDIESPDITAFRDKHGKFRRVLSFFCFHIVKDNLAAYRNVAQLLEPGGECAVVSCVNLVIADIWLQVYNMDQWKAYIPARLHKHNRPIRS
ncbi:hypothetical protein HPB52_005692 [Rhipicephalus sanguineus]|uniref:Methyltransferase domain-containing protein n=1 Tax=Rhipicephalus sanguineus TaxID=34632 RepID=A0A9D4SQ85_RHISA|nr:hypothetical protein HPB52_005692 [Rhipicephalus sanguineus]